MIILPNAYLNELRLGFFVMHIYNQYSYHENVPTYEITSESIHKYRAVLKLGQYVGIVEALHLEIKIY